MPRLDVGGIGVRQVRNCPAKPHYLCLQFCQILGQVVFKTSKSLSPPIIGYFGNSGYHHTVGNRSAARCQLLDMPDLRDNFLSLMFLGHRSFPIKSSCFAWRLLMVGSARDVQIPSWARCALSDLMVAAFYRISTLCAHVRVLKAYNRSTGEHRVRLRHRPPRRS
jgi:hypothetical protein